VATVWLDGTDIAPGPVTLVDDAATHLVEVTLRASPVTADGVAEAA
jgi:hypothetical protein